METRSAGGPELPPRTERVRLLYTNDVHGRVTPAQDRVILGQKAELGGSAYLASLVHRLRAEDPGRTLLLDDGDSVHGQLLTDLDAGKSMADVMTAIGYDAATLGNHDFQWGVPALLERLKDHAQYPVLVSNVVQEDGSALPDTEPHRLFDLKGVKVGVTGVLTCDTEHSQRTDRLQGVKFLDEAESVRRSVQALRAQGAHLVVVLSHMGQEGDVALARQLQGEGLIVLGGHSHDRLHEPLQVEGNWIVQAGSLGKELGSLSVDVDLGRRRVAGLEHRLIPVNPKEIEPDPEVAAMVATFQKRADEAMGDVVGHLAERLTRANHQDGTLGSFVCDSMRLAADADVAFMNTDGLRTDLDEGPVTRKDVYELMPFGGELVKGRLTGQELRDVLEHSVSHRETTPGVQSSFLQVGGLEFSYDATRPEGERLLEVRVGGEPLDPERSYTVALEDYLSHGKLGYSTFRGGSWEEVGLSVNEAVHEGLAAGVPVASAERRIEDRTPR